jgi:hypothetical protein
MHERRFIRQKIVELLKTGRPILGTSPVEYMALDVDGRVYPNRLEALFDSELPCALVYFESESVTGTSSARDVVYRRLDLNVDIVQELREDIDDELDRLAWQTEIILLSDHTLGVDFVNRIQLASTLPYRRDSDNEQKKGVSRLSFSVDYWTEIYNPGTLNEFLTFGKKIVGQVGDGAESEINQTIRES